MRNYKNYKNNKSKKYNTNYKLYTKKKIQKAGVKLGKGSFGCVVKPAIKCKSNQNVKKYVSKIILNVNNSDYKQEIEILNYIKKIDPKNEYCISLIDECKLNTNQNFNRNDKDIIKVKYDTTINQDSNSYATEQYSIVDTDFQTFQSNNSKKELQKNHCLIDPSEKYEYRNQIQVYGGKKIKPILKNENNVFKTDFNLIKKNYKFIITHLLKGCKLMHDNEFIHRDIKFDNLVYSINSNNKPTFRYIDFNLANLFKNKSKILQYSGTPGYIPIDFYLYYKMYNYNKEGNNLNQNDIKSKILNIVILKYIEQIDIIILEADSKLDAMLDGPIAFIETPGKPIKLRRQYPTGKKPKLAYLSVTDKELNKMYDIYKKIIVNKIKHNKFAFNKINGLIYKTDIYSLGIVIGMIVDLLNIKNIKLQKLIELMTHKETFKRLNINSCLKFEF